jgi:hypothetical protein
MTLIERMPSRVMVEPFVVDQPVSKPVIVDDMCKKCGGRVNKTPAMAPGARVCEDCFDGSPEEQEAFAYDPNMFNSMQS